MSFSHQPTKPSLTFPSMMYLVFPSINHLLLLGLVLVSPLLLENMKQKNRCQLRIDPKPGADGAIPFRMEVWGVYLAVYG